MENWTIEYRDENLDLCGEDHYNINISLTDMINITRRTALRTFKYEDISVYVLKKEWYNEDGDVDNYDEYYVIVNKTQEYCINNFSFLSNFKNEYGYIPTEYLTGYIVLESNEIIYR